MKLDQVLPSVRQRLEQVSLASFPGDTAMVKLSARAPSTVQALAAPPAGSDLLPVLGDVSHLGLLDTLRFLHEGPEYALKYYARFGPVFWSKSFGQKMVWVVGPEEAQEVLTNKDKAFSQSGWEFFIGPFFNRGLMLLDGQEHLLHRRIMQEAFARPRLEAYFGQYNRVTQEQVPTWQTDTEILLYPTVKQLTLDIATVVFMGTEPTEETRHLSEAFVDCVRGGTALVRRPIPGGVGRWNAGLRGRETLERYFREQLPAKRASEDRDLFAALCHVETDDGHRFSDDDVVNHMIFLMMAAHDTSTITATAMASFLAVHQEWQERCREEARSVPTLDFASIDALESLDLVFQEAMRLVSPVPAFVRRSTKDTAIGGHHVPAGVIVNVLPGTAHRLPDRWAAVTEFQPERFAEPRVEQKSHRFASMPFGGGAHKCIGMYFGAAEVKAVLHRILLDHRIEVAPGYQAHWDHTSLPKPVDGLPVVLRKL